MQDGPIQAQLADHGVAVHHVGRQRAHGHHQRQGDGEVVVAALLRQVGRRQVAGDVLVGQAQANGMQRAAHPLAAFGDGLVGQADDGERVATAADLHLHVDTLGLDAAERDRGDLPEARSRHDAPALHTVRTVEPAPDGCKNNPATRVELCDFDVARGSCPCHDAP